MPTDATPDRSPETQTERKPRGPVRWGRIVTGLLLIALVAVPCLVGALRADSAAVLRERSDAVGEGSVPGGIQFRATPGQDYVVALSAKPGGVTDDLPPAEREAATTVQAGMADDARCAVRPPDGSTLWLRGFEQSKPMVLDDRYASVGTFVGTPGMTTVGCVFMPPEDAQGKTISAPLMVHEVA
ncbi:MAG: hypothetical protein JHD16_15655, partial [Solirubrobacteraceae bacterium]|nr:hypothetical protein [Solirubrobacteraceae bacterium]